MNIVIFMFSTTYVNYFSNEIITQMKKISTLQDSIHAEQEQLNLRMEEMKVEMNTYEDLEQVQETEDSTRDYLLQMKKRYKKRMEFMKTEVKKVSSQYKVYKEKLSQSETWASLLELEEKLRRQGQAVFSLSDSIRINERDTNFNGVKHSCMCIVADLNKELITGFH